MLAQLLCEWKRWNYRIQAITPAAGRNAKVTRQVTRTVAACTTPTVPQGEESRKVGHQLVSVGGIDTNWSNVWNSATQVPLARYEYEEFAHRLATVEW